MRIELDSRPRHAVSLAAAGISLLVVTFAVASAPAQTTTPADSVGAVEDTVSISWSNPFAVPVAPRIPARRYAFELAEMLREQPASFLYDLGPYGWPHGFSPAGISPQHVDLFLNDVEFNDVFLGRPQYEMLPLSSSDIPSLEYAFRWRPASIDLSTRAEYEGAGQPLTELSYQTSNNGLQKVYGLHTQNRRLSLAGRPGALNLLLSYRGDAADGEYPGSRVQKGRQIYSRVKFLRPGWSLTVGSLYNKRSVGAHAGVLPRVAGDSDSIYQRLGASVIDPDARREDKRNDVFAHFRLDPHGRGTTVTTATAGYTEQRSEYRRPGDTLTVRATRLFFHLSHALTRKGRHLSVDVSGSTATAGPRSAQLAFDEVRDSRLLAFGTGEAHFRGAYASARAGIEVRKEGTQFVSRLALDIPVGPATLRVEGAQTAVALAVLDRTGLGPFVQPLEQAPIGANRIARASLRVAGGPFDLTAFGTVIDNSTWVDYFGTTRPDSISVRSGTASLTVVSVGADAGFRRQALSGFYLTVEPTLFGAPRSENDDQSQYAATLPDFYAVARIGARYRIFRGDLDLDVAIRARMWSEFTGRSFHTQTGLLVIPTSGQGPIESSATLDLIVTAGVRTATFFLAYENFLAGTSALPGNLLVPTYPLADKRLRFGVFWPIQN